MHFVAGKNCNFMFCQHIWRDYSYSPSQHNTWYHFNHFNPIMCYLKHLIQNQQSYIVQVYIIGLALACLGIGIVHIQPPIQARVWKTWRHHQCSGVMANSTCWVITSREFEPHQTCQKSILVPKARLFLYLDFYLKLFLQNVSSPTTCCERRIKDLTDAPHSRSCWKQGYALDWWAIPAIILDSGTAIAEQTSPAEPNWWHWQYTNNTAYC
jgi:hypothetical protein